MVRKKSVLVDRTEDITLREQIALFYFGWLKVPEFCRIEGGNVNTSRDENRLGVLSDDLKGSLDTVKDLIEDTGTKFDSEGLFSSFDGVTDGKTG